MTYLKKEDTIKINKKNFTLSDILEKLILLPSEEIKEYFQTLKLSLPRKLRMMTARTVLDPYLEDKEQVRKLSDEMRYRIGWYDYFSDAQLINLLPQFNDGKLIKAYKVELWHKLVNLMIEKKVSEPQFNKLVDMAEQITSPTRENILAYNENLDALFFDKKDEIDGLNPDTFRGALYKASTLVEIRKIGLKYGVSVPRRLKKHELAEIVKDVLKERGQYTDSEGEKIDNMSVIILQRYAINNEIKASIELKKEEVIEYILKNAQETKANYFVPTDANIYEKLVPRILFEEEEFIEEVQKPVEVIKEEPTPIKEEPVVVKEEPIIVKEVVKEKESVDISEEELRGLLTHIDESKDEIEALSIEIEELKDTEFPVIVEKDGDLKEKEIPVAPLKSQKPVNIYPFHSFVNLKTKRRRKKRKFKKNILTYPLYNPRTIYDFFNL